MGKGTIISGGTDGQYQVSAIYNTDRAQAEKAANLAKISNLEAQISSETDDRRLNVLILQKLSLEKRNSAIDSIPESETINAWCVDLTEDLTGDVGLIEVPGESVGFNIQPGHEDNAEYNETRDGQLFPTMAISPSAAFYNLAMLPGWQKWMPTYRYATISDIDTAADTCSISLEPATSTQQGLDVNAQTDYSDVPIEYMQCNAAAFEDGDAVLVKFTGQDKDNPVVIGFKENPKPCGGFLYVTLEDVCFVWDIENSQYITSAVDNSGNVVSFPVQTSSITDWISKYNISGSDAVATYTRGHFEWLPVADGEEINDGPCNYGDENGEGSVTIAGYTEAGVSGPSMTASVNKTFKLHELASNAKRTIDTSSSQPIRGDGCTHVDITSTTSYGGTRGRAVGQSFTISNEDSIVYHDVGTSENCGITGDLGRYTIRSRSDTISVKSPFSDGAQQSIGLSMNSTWNLSSASKTMEGLYDAYSAGGVKGDTEYPFIVVYYAEQAKKVVTEYAGCGDCDVWADLTHNSGLLAPPDDGTWNGAECTETPNITRTNAIPWQAKAFVGTAATDVDSLNPFELPYDSDLSSAMTALKNKYEDINGTPADHEFSKVNFNMYLLKG